MLARSASVVQAPAGSNQRLCVLQRNFSPLSGLVALRPPSEISEISETEGAREVERARAAGDTEPGAGAWHQSPERAKVIRALYNSEPPPAPAQPRPRREVKRGISRPFSPHPL